MATLYEINRDIMSCIDLESGEIIDYQKLEKLQLDKQTKMENIALWIKNIRSDIKAYEDEEKAFKNKKDAARRQLDSLESLLGAELAGEKFKTAKVSVYYTKRTAVEVSDLAVEALPKKYLRVSISPAKQELKKALENGEVIEGCQLVESTSMVIR